MRMSRRAVLISQAGPKYSLQTKNLENYIGAVIAELNSGEIWLGFEGANSVVAFVNRPTAECLITGLKVGDSVSVTWTVWSTPGIPYSNMSITQVETGTTIVNTTASESNKTYSFTADSPTLSIGITHGDTEVAYIYIRIHNITVNGKSLF